MAKLKLSIWKECLWLTFLCIFSCQNNPDYGDPAIEKFPKSVHLVGNVVKEISFPSRGNVNLLVVDTFLILQRREEKCIHIYSTNTYEPIIKFGTNGSGPGEFINPSLTNQVSRNPTDNAPFIHLYDYSLQRFTQIDVQRASKNQQPFYMQESIANVGADIRYFFYKDSSLLLVTPGADARFLFYNYQTSRIKTVPFIPKLDFSVKPDLLPFIYKTATYVNREKRLIVSAPIFLGEINFFDLNGNLLRSTFFDSRDNLRRAANSIDELDSKVKRQIVAIKAKKNLIYGLNYNNPGSQLFSGKTLDNFKIQVFDWQGVPVMEYILDDKFISSFAVDLIHNRIYGYAPNLDEENIVIYEL